VSHEASSNAPRIVEIAPGAADEEEEEEEAESAAAAAEEMVRTDLRARSDSEMRSRRWRSRRDSGSLGWTSD